jgi:hypothetical protein
MSNPSENGGCLEALYPLLLTAFVALGVYLLSQHVNNLHSRVYALECQQHMHPKHECQITIGHWKSP